MWLIIKHIRDTVNAQKNHEILVSPKMIAMDKLSMMIKMSKICLKSMKRSKTLYVKKINKMRAYRIRKLFLPVTYRNI